MDILSILKSILLFGVILVLTSKPRHYHVDLSQRMTGWGWMLVGVSTLGLSCIVKSQTQGAWRELETLVRIGVGFIGLMFATLGFRKLRRANENSSGSDLDNHSKETRRRGWIFIWVGIASILSIMLSPNAEEQTLDGSPESLVWMASLIVFFVCIMIGSTILRRSPKQK